MDTPKLTADDKMERWADISKAKGRKRCRKKFFFTSPLIRLWCIKQLILAKYLKLDLQPHDSRHKGLMVRVQNTTEIEVIWPCTETFLISNYVKVKRVLGY